LTEFFALVDDDDSLSGATYLIDRSQKLVDAWNDAFSAISHVKPVASDYFQQPADAIVSPANSFGIMDGGLDLEIHNQLGYGVQTRLQAVIVEKYHGKLPVGGAEIIQTGDEKWKYLVAAPTMRVPEPIAFMINAYLAFRAVLLAVSNFNKAVGVRRIDTLVCSGLGTGVGRMSPTRCARHLQMAHRSMITSAAIGRFDSIHEFHKTLHNL